MSQFRMRFFLISLLFIALVVSCSSSITKGLIRYSPEEPYSIQSYFSNIENDYIYKANISILKHKFGGILIIKKIKDNQHRIVLTTEFGNKLFDFNFVDSDMLVNYISEDLNKTLVLKELKGYFQSLVGEDNMIVNEFSNDSINILQSQKSQYSSYYVFSKKANQLIRIVNSSNGKYKQNISFYNITDDIALSIKLEGNKLNLKIQLNYIGKQN